MFQIRSCRLINMLCFIALWQTLSLAFWPSVKDQIWVWPSWDHICKDGQGTYRRVGGSKEGEYPLSCTVSSTSSTFRRYHSILFLILVCSVNLFKKKPDTNYLQTPKVDWQRKLMVSGPLYTFICKKQNLETYTFSLTFPFKGSYHYVKKNYYTYYNYYTTITILL